MRFLGIALLSSLIGCGGTTVEPAETDSGAPSDSAIDSQMTMPDEGVETGTTDSVVADVPDMPDAPIDVGPPTPGSKLDILFVVDNSFSMRDKQLELARGVPELVRQLTNPPSGSTKKAVSDLHIGVITSSLGSHGTSACDPTVAGAHNDDRAHLMPRAGEGGGTGYMIDGSGATVSATCPTPVTASPIAWAFGTPSATAQTAASCVVASVKDDGCGYEETLESMFHFLVDPAPYASAKVTCTFGAAGDACGSNKVVVSGVDTDLLAQRAAFLRPDSSVAIVIISDENDDSLKPAGLNWLPYAYAKGSMQRGWTGCTMVPDDFEPETSAEYATLHTTYSCKSCFEDGTDANCKVPWATDPLNRDVDGRNLRAFHMTQRFGYNFLWSRQRYVDALTKATVPGSDGVMAANPLFKGGRSPANVLFATIVGVPKTLVSGADGLPKTLSAADWDKIISPDLSKRDPHMIESIAPRAGIPKFAGDRSIDAINGGDRDIADGDDLQYACIAPRATTEKTDDCFAPDADKKDPLCGPGTQPYFKAFPGLRHLRVAHDLGDRGFVASICDASMAGALEGLVRKLQPLIK